MVDKIKTLDPFLTVGLIVSVALAILLVLMGQDEVQGLTVGLVTTAITLSVDVIARLKETEKRILQGTALGHILLDDQELHSILHQIAESYRIAQHSGFELFVERSKDAVLECKDLLGALERGYTVVEAGGKYSYGRKGTNRAQKTVKAVAYEDIDSWRTAHLQNVIEVNAEAARRGVQIQRVFVLCAESAAKAKDVLDAHRDAGVQVFTVSPDSLPTTRLLESFMIVDDQITVVFYYTRDGRSFREEKVSIDPVEVDKAVNRFNSILRRAQPYTSDFRAA